MSASVVSAAVVDAESSEEPAGELHAGKRAKLPARTSEVGRNLALRRVFDIRAH